MGDNVSGDPYRPARDDRAAVVERLIDQLPARVSAALEGDREALIGLLVIAADVGWQSRADVLGTVEEVAAAQQQFADAVATCYSTARPPSDQMCDAGFSLADRVDALAIEVLHRRRQAGVADDSEVPRPRRAPAREARHLARAHAAALRDALGSGRRVTSSDVEAAEHLYRVIVTLGREHARQEVVAALGQSPDTSAASDEVPHIRE